ncbi:interleukin-2 receptor subunit beta isoform X2 [Ochotona curzoniae]|nr:interleukin-2 receptor subunit beta isoform X2 [Ochotona curzoniae]XP_040841689.1 interleukin-2 receptor subunit beta isoform X2 [Ochotona curzoniae]
MAAPSRTWGLPLVSLLLLATTPAWAAVDDPGQLTCFYNSKANISCTWSQEGGLPATSCLIHAQSANRFWNKTCKLVQVERSTWVCDLILGLPESQCLTSADIIHMRVLCGDQESRRLVKIQEFKPFNNLRLMAPSSLQVVSLDSRRCNVSWKAFQISHYIQSYLEFTIRTRSPGQSWEDRPLLRLKQKQEWINLENLCPDSLYELQVRVRAQRDDNKVWSPWSQPLAFRTKPEAIGTKQETLTGSWPVPIILGIGGALGFLLMVYLLVHNCAILSWLKKALKCHVPDPSRFFSQLSSEHGGDFQKWLASPFPSSAFSPGGLVPEISQVEVLEKDSKATQLFLQQRDKGALPPSPTASCFTNQGYFFFHLLDALEIEACQVYFTYDPCEQEESEEAVPGTPMGSPLPLLPTVSGEDDAYCTLPPGDEMLLFCPGLLGGPSPPNPALGNSGVREERPPPSPQEGILGSGAPLALGLPSPEAPQLVIIQPALEVVQGEAQEGVAAPGPDEEATSSWVAPPMQDQARTLTSRPALDTNIYLSLQELRDQDPAHAV